MQEEEAVLEIENEVVENSEETGSVVLDNAEEIEKVEDNNSEEVSKEEESEDIEISINGDSLNSEEKEEAPAWVKELRKTNREQNRKIKEYEEQLARQSQPEHQALVDKPTLESFDYDEDKYETALTDWFEKKKSVDAQVAEQQRTQQEVAEQWQGKLNNYAKAKSELKVKDYDDVEDVVKASLNDIQQSVIVQGAENPALLVYAIGKDPKRAEDLAKIKDPVQFAFAVSKLEKDLKVTKKKVPPAPERTLKGSAPSNALDSMLEKLRNEAEKTGNMTKVLEYKRKLKQKG